MVLIRADDKADGRQSDESATNRAAPSLEQDAPHVPTPAPTLEQTVRAWHDAGRSQRAIARELNIDRRKVKQITEQNT
jgi:hypothetical protein